MLFARILQTLLNSILDNQLVQQIIRKYLVARGNRVAALRAPLEHFHRSRDAAVAKSVATSCNVRLNNLIQTNGTEKIECFAIGRWRTARIGTFRFAVAAAGAVPSAMRAFLR